MADNAVWITSLALVGVLAWAIYMGKRSPGSSPEQTASNIVFADPYQQSNVSGLHPSRIDWVIPGGVAGIDATDLTAYQRWAISRGYYDIDRMQSDGYLDIDVPWVPFI